MNLRDLDYLVAVARELHFGRAAQSCNVSQPTLSMQLKKLEETLGVQLFERTNKTVILTPVGRDIASRAARVLEEMQQVRQVAKSAKDPLAGKVRLGIFPTLAPYILPMLMPAFSKAFAQLELLLIEEKTPILIQQLEEGLIDCAMLAMPVSSPHLSHHTLFTEPFVLAVSATHRLAKRSSVTRADIAHESMLLLEDGHCLREQALEVCHLIGMGEAQHFRATSLETLRHMVAASEHITLMPRFAVRDDDTHVRYIPFKSHAPARTIGLYSRKTSARAKLYAAMTDVIQKTVNIQG